MSRRLLGRKSISVNDLMRVEIKCFSNFFNVKIEINSDVPIETQIKENMDNLFINLTKKTSSPYFSKNVSYRKNSEGDIKLENIKIRFKEGLLGSITLNPETYLPKGMLKYAQLANDQRKFMPTVYEKKPRSSPSRYTYYTKIGISKHTYRG